MIEQVKMHFKGIIWGGLREKFEISVKKKEQSRLSSSYLILIKKKCIFVLGEELPYMYKKSILRFIEERIFIKKSVFLFWGRVTIYV